MAAPWYTIANADEVPSPALLVYLDRAAENIRRMIACAGSAERLRPHVKTHKTAELTRMQLAAGISRFKCSTIAEAEMVASAGATDVLLAMSPVGPNIGRFLCLAAAIPRVSFSTLTDDPEHVRAVAEAARAAGASVELLVDLDNGMHRSGIAPDERAFELYRTIAATPGVRPGGLHVYDGHLRNPDRSSRQVGVDRAFEPIAALRARLVGAGLPVPRVVAGGTFSFPIHAQRADVELGPGTPVLWDQSYTTKLPDLDFLPALVILTRVVSRPAIGQVTLDLGYKALSADNPDPRVALFDLPDARMVNHSEEHLVVETAAANRVAVGDVVYGIPWHVCPTVSLHDEMHVVKQGRVVGTWPILARRRRLTI
ncbi:MAG TPA: D-TA family PLP-dependent enzyme [Pirellulales bacterium]|nr:D-TA family PLP-dependent enzyme [Pirellulales bacterium]